MVQTHIPIATLDVVIPIFNEESRLHSCLEQIYQLKNRVNIQNVYFVDDGSTDDSIGLLKRENLPNWITILPRPHLGKGAAIRHGLQHTSAEYVLLSDVDWSVSPNWIPELFQCSGDVVIAVREGHGARRIGEPVWRHLLGRIFNHYVQWVAMAGHADTQCGCKLLSRKAVEQLTSLLKTNGWAFDVELLAQAHINGLLVSEVPVAWCYDSDSRVRPLRDGFQMVVDVLRIRRRLKRQPSSTDLSRDPYHQQALVD